MPLARQKNERIHEFQTRRRQAVVRLLEEGETSVTKISAQVGVTRKYVLQWKKDWQAGKTDMACAAVSGAKPRLTQAQKDEIALAIAKGPETIGLKQQLWTQASIAKLIENLSGVSYHPNSISTLMASMRISCQKPRLRAKKRNDAAIDEFKTTTWPEIKKGPSTDSAY